MHCSMSECFYIFHKFIKLDTHKKKHSTVTSVEWFDSVKKHTVTSFQAFEATVTSFTHTSGLISRIVENE